jgi:hypothetical protein
MKLQDFKVIFINPDHNEKYHQRKVYMIYFLKKLGFKDIVHHKSGTEAYPLCLTLATMDVLKKYMDEPFILLEDDLEYTGESLDIPIENDVDAIYLGLGRGKGDPILNANNYYAEFEPYSDSQVRVINMLTAHSILYYSKRYKEALYNTLSREYKNFCCDISMSHIQQFFKVLATKKPRFFQSNLFNVKDRFDGQKATKTQVDDNCKFQPYTCPDWIGNYDS